MQLYLHVGMFVRRQAFRVRAHWRNRLMELYLQFGYGMMEHCRSLISAWGQGTVILSPRDLSDNQLRRLSKTVRELPNSASLLDPQFYLPHADHERLCSHDFWPKAYSTGAFFGGPALNTLLKQLADLNREIGCAEMILPGLLAATIDDDWLNVQTLIIEEARSMDIGLPLYPTIALSGDSVRSDSQVALLLEKADSWKADGYYVVCEHPKGNYLVDDANWLANVLDIVAGLRLARSKVILGYCNHQILIAAAAKVSAIASGTWMNVRSFPPEKFRSSYDEEIKQRSTWYYCPQALSEYKLPFLDIAQKMGILNLLSPPPQMDSEYVSALFSGGQPSTVGLTEQAAFRHYLTCLRVQTENAERSTFDETVQAHEQVLQEAESLLRTLTAAGIRGQQRDFSDIIDVNRAALSVLTRTRGPILRRFWSSL